MKGKSKHLTWGSPHRRPWNPGEWRDWLEQKLDPEAIERERHLRSGIEYFRQRLATKEPEVL